MKRFVNGITDDAFVQLVGPSVILPSYVVFNHLCRKLAQLDLADHVALVDAQLALWRFFWGDDEDDGYLATLTEPEQVAALELLDRHHAEAVLMASVFQAYEIAWHEADDRLDALRDVWRQVLVHDLWQPTSEALSDAAAVAGVGPDPIPVLNLIDELDGLARYYDENDARRVIATALGTPTSSVSESEGRVARGELGEQTVDIYVVNDPAVPSHLRRLRVSCPSSRGFGPTLRTFVSRIRRRRLLRLPTSTLTTSSGPIAARARSRTSFST